MPEGEMLRSGVRNSRWADFRRSVAINIKERPANYFILAFVLVSIILQIAGDVTSGWLVVDISTPNPFYNVTVEFEFGLIYVKSCVRGDCVIELSDEFRLTNFGVSDKKLLGYRISAGIGILMILASTICTCKATCCNKNITSKRCALSTIFVFTLLSGVAALWLVDRFGLDTLDAHRALGDNSPYRPPYSLIMTAAGGLFAVMAAITTFIELCRACCCDPDPRAQFSGEAVTWEH